MESETIKTSARLHGVPIIKDKSHELLMKLVAKKNPKHILEIGTAVGYSGISMLGSCSADLITIEHNRDFVKAAQKNFKKYGFGKRVKIIEGDCMVETARLLTNPDFDEYFDFIFLDGPKAQYTNIFDSLMMLLAPGGTFVADNVLFRGYVENTTSTPTKRYKTITKRLNEFIEKCKNSPFLTKFILNNTEDGLIIAEKVQNEK